MKRATLILFIALIILGCGSGYTASYLATERTRLQTANTATPEFIYEPVVLEGKGDAILEFDAPWTKNNLAMIFIEQFGGGELLAFGIDENAEAVDVIVVGWGDYASWRPFMWKAEKWYDTIMIKSNNRWRFTIMAYVDAGFPVVQVPDFLRGHNDSVIGIDGKPSKLTMSCEQEDLWIYAYGEDLKGDNIIDVSCPWEGTISLPDNTTFLDIWATGDWTAQVY